MRRNEQTVRLESTDGITIKLCGGSTVMDGARDAYELEKVTGEKVMFIHNDRLYKQALVVEEVVKEEPKV
jgi:hypothetical protein